VEIFEERHTKHIIFTIMMEIFEERHTTHVEIFEERHIIFTIMIILKALLVPAEAINA
jgi:hypothetical protein